MHNYVVGGVSSRPRAGSRKLQLLWLPWNPGNLRFNYVAPRRRRNLPLVVILHGCGQDGPSYARDAGWMDLAKREGFALLVVDQEALNNPDRCFNWFSPLHNQRERGEAASIAAAIRQLVQSEVADGKRVFVTGLSAGGAMASVMLATYPELFEAGAILAGIPYGCANWVGDARDCMAGDAKIAATDLASAVFKASKHKGPWPRISVWHGLEDRRVVPANSADIVRQWLTVQRLQARPHVLELVDGHPRRAWLDQTGKAVVEQYEIVGLGHGTPIVSEGTSQLGRIGRNVVDASISSTERIAQFFGLMAPETETVTQPRAA